MYKILFELTQEYYLPSFLPIYKHMKNDRDLEVFFRVGLNQKRFLGIFLLKQKKRIEADLHKMGLKTTDSVSGFDAVICGTTLKNPQKYGNALLFNVDHGPGLKTLRYREFLKQKKIQYHVFIEGDYREEKFQKYGLDKFEKLYKVGLPKLDPFFNNEFDKETLLREFRLNPNKKTVLYAPSYKPTSIFEIAKTIEQIIPEYNLIIKLHPYSWNGKYASHSQHRIFEKMVQKNKQIHLVDKSKHNMMSYLFVADTMVSDGSSVINEFLALGRCGIIYDLDYSKLKHSDGQPLLENDTKEWLKNSFVHISNPDDLLKAVGEAISPNPERKKHLTQDKNYVFSYIDGKSGLRVKNAIKKKLSGKEINEEI